jgi:hypothetical protein
MSDIAWYHGESVIKIAGDRSLGSVLQRLDKESPDWVVVVREMFGSSDVYYYACRASELHYLADQHSEQWSSSITMATGMHEWSSSGRAHSGHFIGPQPGDVGPAAGRVIDFDSLGEIIAVGEWMDMIPREAMAEAAEPAASLEVEAPLEAGGEDTSLIIDLGPMRGGAGAGDTLSVPSGGASPGADVPLPAGAEPAMANGGAGAEADADIEVTLSAETESEIEIGAEKPVRFRIELAAEATPLALSQNRKADPNTPIVVSLSAESPCIEIVQEGPYTFMPPKPGEPRRGIFLIKGVREGVSRLAVTFRQGGSELGVIGLAVEVVARPAAAVAVQGNATAAPREVADDDKLALIIEQRTADGETYYQYILHSEALGLQYRPLRSKRLLDRDGQPAASPTAFVEHIYERVTQELKTQDDLRELQREARALGASLCRELFDPEVSRALWPLRDRIKLIQVVSWEPYIPWELVRLENPDTQEIDDRFLAEYGLVRTLSDATLPRALPMTSWSYLGSAYPAGTLQTVGAELTYFTGDSPESLKGRGITASPIESKRDAFYDALASCEFDVLHISCHGESVSQSIEKASLIIGEETLPGTNQVRLIEVDTITVEAEARLKQRHPLVFLNACETGRMGPQLTAWGGWPNTFLRAGAGAFVGSAWAVRDKPAAAFSTAFYNALLDGKTLAEAATDARAAAKQLGDASWLAFKVYGHPRASRREA